MMSSFSRITSAGLLLGLGLTVSATANATVYAYDITNPPGSANAGDVTHFSTTYNDVSQQLTFSSTITRQNGHLADGFWLVLSDGPNPKNNYNEYAIFYGDGINNTLTSYVYNGANSASSWNNPGEFIQNFGSMSIVNNGPDEVTFSFDINVASLNAYTPSTPGTNDWDGAQFADLVGIWYHPLVFKNGGPTYNADGSLASFPVDRNGWYDTSNRTTTVPAPGVALLTLMGLAGIVGIRRRLK